MAQFDWDDLRFFLAVARTGRLTTAAKQLNADHATVSRRVSSLEAAFKAKLFERRPQGYSLTEHGQRLLEIAEQMESQAQSAVTQISGADQSLSGTVRLGATEGFASFFLAPRLQSLLKACPGLQLQVAVLPQLISLSKREADLAVTLAPPNESKAVVRKLTDFTLKLYAAKTYLERFPRITSLDDLHQHTLIGFVSDLMFTPELNVWSEIDPKLRVRLEVSSITSQMRAAAAGAGIALLPCMMAAAEPDLIHVLPEAVSLQRSLWLVFHVDLKDIARVRAVADFLVAEVKASKSLFLPLEGQGLVRDSEEAAR